MEIETYRGFIIPRANQNFQSQRVGKYWITKTLERYGPYMHKDGTLHPTCGDENFFDTLKEARAVIDKHLEASPE